MLLCPITLSVNVTVLVEISGKGGFAQQLTTGGRDLAMTASTILWFRKHLSREKAGYLELGLQVCSLVCRYAFLLVHFLAALLGYQIWFYRGDTWKPSWTDALD